MAEFNIVDLSQVDPYELDPGDYTLHVVGADNAEYLERHNKVQIDVLSSVVVVWASENGSKRRKLAVHLRERVMKITPRAT